MCFLKLVAFLWLFIFTIGYCGFNDDWGRDIFVLAAIAALFAAVASMLSGCLI